ncbi:hypothetical protein ROA7745_02697 [Roseovarius aestuarii]|uniref:Transposase DDE domain protein n=1 Tax=Roseovarius aestuarii TaxID=475083 RepID=A0A1X7BTE7_9RHOB|nr:hypothetical protein ROA7745_02697 [Roseovarius aestuarii]
MAHVDPAFVEEILNIAKRKWKSNVHHDRKADDLRAGFEIAERGAFCHPAKLRNRMTSLKPVSSDSTVSGSRARRNMVFSQVRACIPGRKQRKKPVKYDKRRYKRRNRIEIMFGRLKDW